MKLNAMKYRMKLNAMQQSEIKYRMKLNAMKYSPKTSHAEPFVDSIASRCSGNEPALLPRKHGCTCEEQPIR